MDNIYSISLIIVVLIFVGAIVGDQIPRLFGIKNPIMTTIGMSIGLVGLPLIFISLL